MGIRNEHLDGRDGRCCGNCYWMKIQVFIYLPRQVFADCLHPLKPISYGFHGWRMDSNTGRRVPKLWGYANGCEYFYDMRGGEGECNLPSKNDF